MTAAVVGSSGYPLDLRNISKVFGHRSVLNAVNMRLTSGCIHGIVGNNGAGKSTLIKIIAGSYSAMSGGHIEINGHVARQGYDERTAREFGVRVVHQEAPLIDSFTVSEMVAILDGYPTRFGLVNWRAVRARTQHVLGRFGTTVDPRSHSALLSAADRALVTLAIALSDTGETAVAPLVILDEATASVPAEQARTYLEAVRTVAAQGGIVLMISHRLNEITEYCDSVTVLNDGHAVHQGATKDIALQDLNRLMLAEQREKHLQTTAPKSKTLPMTWGFGRSAEVTRAPRDHEVLAVKDLHGALVNGVSFSVRAGEIVGLSGLFGGGVSQVARLIAGVDTATRGTVELHGRRAFRAGRIHQALGSGIVYLSDNRAREGGISTLSMQENLVLPTVGRYWARRSRERARVAEALDLLEIRPPQPDLPFGVLSGGNQQKVLLAKLLLTCPQIIVLDDPTVGVDPQSRETIFAVLREVVLDGRAAIVTSSEPDQLARVCDRVLIIGEGRVVRELAGADVSASQIALAMA